MKIFLTKIIAFFFVFGFVFSLGIFLPATPKASDYYLYSKLKKDSLMQNVSSPRVILVGGSNLVFGLNSKIIKDSLKLNPINDGLTATVGLVFMMDNILPFIRKGDIVVIAPEYQHFYKNFAYGGNDLVRLVLDVDNSSFKMLNQKQWINVIKSYPNYFISKLNPKEYFYYEISPIYKLNIFNEFGDSKEHWKINTKQKIVASKYFEGNFNYQVLMEIMKKDSILKEKGATLMVTFPCYQSTSFDINHKQIKKIETELSASGLIILGSPSRYKMPDSLMFDTPYHLIKKGADLRTKLLVEDIFNTNIIIK